MSQGELAQRAGLSSALIYQVEAKDQVPKQETLCKLAVALNEEPDVLYEAARSDKGLPVGQNASLQSQMGLISQEDQRLLTDLVWKVVDQSRPAISALRDTARQLLVKEHEHYLPNETAVHYKATSLMLLGASYLEEEAVPPEIGCRLIQKAEKLALRIRDSDLLYHAMWFEAIYHRRTADVTKDTKEYQKAATLSDIGTNGTNSLYLQVLFMVEAAKVALGEGRLSAFAENIQQAEGLLRTANDGSPRPTEVDRRKWPTLTSLYPLHLIIDAKLRACAVSGGLPNEIQKLCLEAGMPIRSDSLGLPIIFRVTSLYSMAQTFLRSSNETERIHGFNLWLQAFEITKDCGFTRQLFNGRRIARKQIVKNPVSGLWMACRRCLKETFHYYDRDMHAYVCLISSTPFYL